MTSIVQTFTRSRNFFITLNNKFEMRSTMKTFEFQINISMYLFVRSINKTISTIIKNSIIENSSFTFIHSYEFFFFSIQKTTIFHYEFQHQRLTNKFRQLKKMMKNWINQSNRTFKNFWFSTSSRILKKKKRWEKFKCSKIFERQCFCSCEYKFEKKRLTTSIQRIINVFFETFDLSTWNCFFFEWKIEWNDENEKVKSKKLLFESCYENFCIKKRFHQIFITHEILKKWQ